MGGDIGSTSNDYSEKRRGRAGLQKAHSKHLYVCYIASTDMTCIYIVVVAFHGMSGPTDEVHIPDSVRLRTKSIKHDNGQERVVVDLSELLPLAMEHASTPMKSMSHSG